MKSTRQTSVSLPEGVTARVQCDIETEEYIVVLRERGGDRHLYMDDPTEADLVKRVCAMYRLGAELQSLAIEELARSVSEGS